MPNADAPSKVSILLEEYKLHKGHFIAQVQVYQTQTQFIQLYGALIGGLVAILHALSGKVDALLPSTAAGQAAAVLILVLAAAVPFYLAASAMNATYTMLVLRQRMGAIEKLINFAYGEPDLLTFESSSAARVFEDRFYAKMVPSPHTISGVFRIVILIVVAALLASLGAWILPALIAAFYATAVVMVCFWMIYQYLRMSTAFGRRAIQTAMSHKQIHDGKGFRVYFGNVSFNYLAVAVLLYFLTNPEVFQQLVSKISAFAIWQHYRDSPLLPLLLITAYMVGTSTILPLPSEAPLLLWDVMPIWSVLVATLIGKFCGTWILLRFRRRSDGKHLHDGLASAERNLGAWSFFRDQALPLTPMRRSTWKIAGSPATLKILCIASIGAVCRLFAFWLMLWLASTVLGILTPKAPMTQGAPPSTGMSSPEYPCTGFVGSCTIMR